MIEMCSRVKFIRNHFSLTQYEFGKKINFSQNYVAQMEIGTRKITDRTIKDICREFKVDYRWLTTGEGEMFAEVDDMQLLDRLDDILMGESDFHKSVVKMVINMNDNELAIIKKMIDQFKKN